MEFKNIEMFLEDHITRDEDDLRKEVQYVVQSYNVMIRTFEMATRLGMSASDASGAAYLMLVDIAKSLDMEVPA